MNDEGRDGTKRLDRAIDAVARGIVARPAPGDLRRRVLARVADARRPWRLGLPLTAGLVAGALVVATVLLMRPTPPQRAILVSAPVAAPSHPPGDGPVDPPAPASTPRPAVASRIARATPPTRSVPRSFPRPWSNVDAVEPLPVPEPIQVEPLASPSVDVPPIRVSALSVEPLAIEPLATP